MLFFVTWEQTVLRKTLRVVPKRKHANAERIRQQEGATDRNGRRQNGVRGILEMDHEARSGNTLDFGSVRRSDR